MDVDFIGWNAKVFRHSNCKEVFKSIDQTLNQLFGCETLKLLVRNRQSYSIVPNGIEDPKLLAHINEIITTVQFQYRLAKRRCFE